MSLGHPYRKSEFHDTAYHYAGTLAGGRILSRSGEQIKAPATEILFAREQNLMIREVT